MKKLMFVLLLIVSIGFLAAVESDPSATVGYFKMNIPLGWSAVSIPFQIVDPDPIDIFHGTFGCSEDFSVVDRIVDPYNGSITSNYGEGYDWDWAPDPYVDFGQPGHIYWIERTQTQASYDMFILGTVNPQPFSLTMDAVPVVGGWTPFSINDAKAYPLSTYLPDGVTPINPNYLGFNVTEPDPEFTILDRIVCMDTEARIADYYGADYGWLASDGLPYYIEPGKAYYYQSKQNSSWVWSFTPSPAPARNSNPISNSLETINKRSK